MTPSSDRRRHRVVPRRARRTEPRRTTCSLTVPVSTVPERTERDMSSPKGFTVDIDEPDGERVVIRVKGELDMAAVPDLTEAIVGAKGSARVTLDLSAV